MDVSKRFCDGEHKYFVGMKKQCQCYSLIVKVVKYGCFGKCSRYRAPSFFQNEGGV